MPTVYCELRKKKDNSSKIELEKVEEELAEKYSEEYYEMIKQRTAGIDSEDGGMTTGKVWSLKNL